MLDAQDEAFRVEVRRFLEEHLPPDVRRRTRIGMHPPHEPDRRWWNRVLFDRGWVAPHWPREHGGTGWSPIRQHLFEAECWRAHAPELRWQGLRLLGPVIYTFGSEPQKARYLPPILRGDEYWAQGFSEPGAGSDLVSLKTTAVREGDTYVINGQKLWTSEAQFSDGIFILARTEATEKRQRALSMLLVPLSSPGVRVRPVPLIDGGVAVNEIFFDDVRVPAENLVGAPGSGWTQAKFLLENERTGSAELHRSRCELARMRAVLRSEQRDGRPLAVDPHVARTVEELEIELDALEWSVLRVLCDAPQGRAAVLPSILKVRGSEIQQRIAELGAQALGVRGLRLWSRDEAFAARPDDVSWPDHVPGVMVEHLYLRACTIYGGAKEVQKNIIAKQAFGF